MKKSAHTGSIPMQQNWLALKRVAKSHFKILRQAHPDWTSEGMLDALELPRTALMMEIAAATGFKCGVEPTPEEICAVLGRQVNGERGAEIIASETGITLPKVQRILEMWRTGYGKAPFGSAPYGGNRAISNGKSFVSRRITVKGQLSYRGQRYSLGALYRGRTVMVREKDRDLLITCNDRSPIHVTRYT